MQKVNIETTQNVVISYDVANLGDRILAYLLDSLIIIAYTIIVFAIGSLFMINDDSFIWIWIVLYLPVFVYHLLFEIFRDGQSPGKQQMKIKVVKLDGTEPSVGSFILRWIIRPVDLFFYGGVAILCIVAGGKGQRLGDIAAGTAVIKLKGSVANPKQQIIKKLQEDYVPVFPEAAQLSDKDIDIIIQALKHYQDTSNMKPVKAIHKKVLELLKISSDMEEIAMLRTVIKDYNHFATHGS